MQIPANYAQRFRKFFLNFDSDLERLNVLAYGISVTTLEDVFMKVGHMNDPMDVLDGKKGNHEKRSEAFGS